MGIMGRRRWTKAAVLVSFSYHRHCTSWGRDQALQSSWGAERPDWACRLVWYILAEEGFPSDLQTYKRAGKITLLLQNTKNWHQAHFAFITSLWLQQGSCLWKEPVVFTNLVGIMSRKSSPGGQSLSLSTIGCPSSDRNLSARGKDTKICLVCHEYNSFELNRTWFLFLSLII